MYKYDNGMCSKWQCDGSVIACGDDLNVRSLKALIDDDFKEKFEYIKIIPLLFIDDIGTENITSWGRDKILGTILQYRMEEGLTTFFTSNLTYEELESALSLT